MSLPIGVRSERLHSDLPLRGHDAIASTLDALDLPIEEYFLVGGANLVLRGIKAATRDIDALCSDELFSTLSAFPEVKLKNPPKSALVQGATNMTVWLERDDLAIPFTATTKMGDGYYPQSFETHKDQTELVDGYPCVELDVVRASKAALRRPWPASDLSDIVLIDTYLGIETEPLPDPFVFAPHLRS